MRLRDLTPAERRAVEERRAEVRAALAGVDPAWRPDAAAIDEAPFLDDWSVRNYPGTDRPCIDAYCWGHPLHGDTILKTSVIVQQGPGYAIVESGKVYLLGSPSPEPEARSAILSGRRGKGRPIDAPAPEDEADTGFKVG
ncbi:hypothetical protein AFCDBAGC_0091 [Methylobacterium cerastii]|uniref:Uncharacterized protein n=1 Tax=Methylobacterium cerastii TaxID=932741 RepID=A0ABQ4QAK3_9HYPH|nr:hypothetical protein [Methylobacterium cerastii]GJD42256.1 hypothetical protein AFCDBAGC_0091 [Methylobacterium cerastii]